MSFFNRIRPDSGFVSPVRSDPGFVSPIRSDPVRSDPVRSDPGFVNGRFEVRRDKQINTQTNVSAKIRLI